VAAIDPFKMPTVPKPNNLSIKGTVVIVSIPPTIALVPRQTKSSRLDNKIYNNII